MTEKQKEFKHQSPDIDLAKFEGRSSGGDYPVALNDPDPFMAMVERLSANPNVDVDKIERILKMNEQVLDRNEKKAFNESFTKAQSKIELVVAEAENIQTKSNYAKLSSVLVKAKEHWESEGFGMMYYEGETAKENHKRTMVDIRHNQGHTETRYIDLAIQTTGIAGKTMMTEIHGEGSSFSYGRRYLTCMIWNIPTGDDDDGNVAGAKGGEFITEGQAKEIGKRLKATYGDKIKPFLDFFNVETVDTILAENYGEVISSLKTAEAATAEANKQRAKAKREPREEG